MSLDSAALKAFFKLVYGPNVGYVCLAFSPDLKQFRERYFEWPRQLDEMLVEVETHRGTENCYFCPQLLETRKRNKDNIKSAPNVWADLDTCTPEKLLVEPSIILESSPGRFQGVWGLEEALDPYAAEDIARRIAYFHAAHGADRSGWDLSQLLRIPTTFNFKYGESWQAPQVTVRRSVNSKFRASDFAIYPEVRGTKELTLPLPEGELTEEPLSILQRNRYRMNPNVFGLFDSEPEFDWSRALWRMLMYMFEAGLTREEVFHVAKSAACNKYSRDNKPLDYLWRDVCRAYLRQQENTNSVVTSAELSDIITDDELRDLEGRDTFVEQYIKWAAGTGDAAVAYHTAGAFVTLSALMAGTVKIPTSWGNIIPNLWFMILGDTTITRKSTAMGLSMDLLEEVDDDILLATDGTVEGLMTALSLRPSKPSVFWRDEISGMLEAMTRKDYMAGMAEAFTQLYDGKTLKRILRKEVFKIPRPILIMFTGGIKSRVQTLLSYEHVASGFIPRFLFLTAVSDIQKVKPLGPPTARDMGDRDIILGRVRHMYDHYNQMGQLEIQETGIKVARPLEWDATLTPEAWARYNKLEADMLSGAMGTDKQDLMVPLYSRLAVSILKAATLIAASRQREDRVLVEEEDIVRAIRYGQDWRHYANDVVNGIGKNQMERDLDRILAAITKNPGVSRGTLMQNFHITARAADGIFGTLEQRGQITMVKQGRGMTYHPIGGD